MTAISNLPVSYTLTQPKVTYNLIDSFNTVPSCCAAILPYTISSITPLTSAIKFISPSFIEIESNEANAVGTYQISFYTTDDINL